MVIDVKPRRIHTPRRRIDRITTRPYSHQCDAYNLMNKESVIDRRYRERILHYYFNQPILKGCQKHPKWVAPCPFCSPGRKTESKRNEKVCALIWVDSWNTWTFTCRRDACVHRKLSFANLIKALNPDLFREYQREKFHSGAVDRRPNCVSHKIAEARNNVNDG